MSSEHGVGEREADERGDEEMAVEERRTNDVDADAAVPDVDPEFDAAVPDVDATACTYTDYVEGESPEAFPKTGDGAEGVEAAVWDALYAIDDPEMPVSIVDLGLVYGVDVTDGRATVTMTLTYSGCPARKYLTEDISASVGAVDGVDDVTIELVWNPPWNLDMMTEQGRRDLQEFGLSV